MADLPTIKANDMVDENPDLKVVVEKETPAKTWLVNYVGEKLSPENGEVTVEMIVNVMSAEFPEFLLALAEENWLRGYRQGVNDVEVGRAMAEQEVVQENVNGES